MSVRCRVQPELTKLGTGTKYNVWAPSNSEQQRLVTVVVFSLMTAHHFRVGDASTRALRHDITNESDDLNQMLICCQK